MDEAWFWQALKLIAAHKNAWPAQFNDARDALLRHLLKAVDEKAKEAIANGTGAAS